MMADGYTRASGKMSMMVAQNGPGITNFRDTSENCILEPHTIVVGHTTGGKQINRPRWLPRNGTDEPVR